MRGKTRPPYPVAADSRGKVGSCPPWKKESGQDCVSATYLREEALGHRISHQRNCVQQAIFSGGVTIGAGMRLPPLSRTRDGIATSCSIMPVYNIGPYSGLLMKVWSCNPADREEHTLTRHRRPSCRYGGPLADMGGLLADNGGSMTDIGGTTTEMGGPLADTGGPMTDTGGPLAEKRGPLPDRHRRPPAPTDRGVPLTNTGGPLGDIRGPGRYKKALADTSCRLVYTRGPLPHTQGPLLVTGIRD